jgi:hypothetical protein
VLALTGFVVGFAMRKEVVKEVQVEKVVYQDKIVEKIVEVEKIVYQKYTDKDINKTVKTDKTTETKPDGTTIVKETTTETVTDKTKESEKEDSVKEVVKEVEKIVYLDKEIIKQTEVVRDWRVGVKLGTSVTNFKLDPLVPPYVSPIIVGIEGERRIFGSLYGGIWAQTSSFQTLEAGIGVSLLF